MTAVTLVLLYATLLLCGGYFGVVLMCEIGVLPAMRRLSLPAYAEAWRAMDTYLARWMPPHKGSLLLVNAGVTVCLWLTHGKALAVACAISFCCSVLGLVFTVRGQLPLNERVKAMPADAPEGELLEIREQTVRGFRVRFWLAAVAFGVLCLGVVVWPVR